jgi:MFS family permease
MGLSFVPLSALLPELVLTNTRCTGSGVVHNLASILGAALSPFAATWLAQKFGAGSFGLYLALLTVTSLIALLASKETRFTNLDTMSIEATEADFESTSP